MTDELHGYSCFKLEALLNHRRHQEENCQKELAKADRKLADERETLEQKKRKKQAYLEQLQSKKKGHTTVNDIMLYIDYIEQLSRDIEYQAMQVRYAIKMFDQKRQDLIAAMKKHETLKKLKFEEKQAYQRKMMLDERKLTDEIASIRHARKR